MVSEGASGALILTLETLWWHIFQIMELRPLDPGGEARKDGSAAVQDGDSLPGCQDNRKTGKYRGMVRLESP
jgi:hypothetical protein